MLLDRYTLESHGCVQQTILYTEKQQKIKYIHIE